MIPLIRCVLICLAIALATSTHSVHAGYFNPNSTVFLSSYTGSQGADLQVNYVDVLYSAGAKTFTFTATMNGAIGTTPGVLYVFGLDRGLGTARFTTGIPSIGPNIVFDSVVLLRADGTGQFNDLITPGNSTALSSEITISGNTITAMVAASLIPTEGLALSQYTYNLWPRLGTGSNSQISQFVPSNMNIGVSVVPEPASLVLAISGLGLVVVTRRLAAR